MTKCIRISNSLFEIIVALSQADKAPEKLRKGKKKSITDPLLSSKVRAGAGLVDLEPSC